VVNAPVPQRIVDAIMAADIAPAAPARATATAAPEGLLADLFGRFSRLLTPQWAPAVATGLLVVGAGLGMLVQSALVKPSPAVEASGVLLRALDTAKSGNMVAAIAGREAPGNAETRLTFKAKSSEFCRQYVTEEPSGQYFAGVACRGPGGKWVVRHHAQIERRPSALDKTVPANDPLATLAPVISRLMAGDALGPDEEAAVIAKHWRE
jgi:surface antigen